MNHRYCIFAFAAVLSSLAPRPATANEATASSAETDKDQARKMFGTGLDYYSNGKYPEAYAQFRASWSLYKHYGTAANLADCELRLGKTRDAAEHLAYVIRVQPADAPDRAGIEAAYEKALRSVGTLRISAPAGADLRVDGVIIGKAPLEDPVFVDPGAHTVESIWRAETVSMKVELQAGQTKDLSLAPRAAASPGDPLAPPDEPGRTSSGLSPMIPVGLGLGVVGIGLGIGFTVAANGKASDRDAQLAELDPEGISGNVCGAGSAHRAECAAIQDLHDSRSAFQTGAIVGYAVGGAALVGTSIYWVVSRNRDRPNSANIQFIPTVGSRYSGVDLIGTF